MRKKAQKDAEDANTALERFDDEAWWNNFYFLHILVCKFGYPSSTLS